MVPDVIVTKGAHRLLVEIVVTHRCGPEKIERIQGMGVSAVEIDLSGLPRDADAGAIERALCDVAPRWWVSNSRLDEAAAQLKAQLDQEEADLRARRERAAERERERLAELVTSTQLALARPLAQRRWSSEHRRVVEAAGYGRFIGLPVEGDGCFAVERTDWQAALLKVAVVDQAARPTASWEGLHTTDILKVVRLRPLLRPGIRDFFSSADESAVRAVEPAFHAPYRVVEAYLGHLAASGLLYQSQKRWCLTRQAQHEVSEHQRRERAILERRQSILRSVKRILAMLPPEEVRGFTVSSWLNSVVSDDGRLAGELLDGSAGDVVALGRRLTPLEAMVSNDGKPAEDLLGLPLDSARERQRLKHEARAEEERRKLEAAVQRETDHRVAALTASATAALGAEGASWIRREHSQLGGRSPFEAAAASDAGFWSADAQLRAEEVRWRRLREVEALRDRLKDAARSSPEPERALLFLTSTNRSWENRRPIEHCVDEGSFRRIVRAMAAAARR